MTINHRAEAVRLAEESHSILRPNDEGYCEADRLLAEAQVHATLARGEADAASQANARDALTLLRRREYAMRDLVSAHIAKALISKDADRWKAGRDLAQALDAADANIDNAVDEHLADDGYQSRTVWQGPGIAEAVDDPWAPKPDITSDVPEPVRRVIAGLLAEMFLDRDDDKVRTWAAGITYELKHVGADLTKAVEKRIYDMTLGADPSEPPF